MSREVRINHLSKDIRLNLTKLSGKDKLGINLVIRKNKVLLLIWGKIKLLGF